MFLNGILSYFTCDSIQCCVIYLWYIITCLERLTDRGNYFACLQGQWKCSIHAFIRFGQSQPGFWAPTAHSTTWRMCHAAPRCVSRDLARTVDFESLNCDWTLVRLKKMSIVRGRIYTYRWRLHTKFWSRHGHNYTSSDEDSPSIRRQDGSLRYTMDRGPGEVTIIDGSFFWK